MLTPDLPTMGKPISGSYQSTVENDDASEGCQYESRWLGQRCRRHHPSGSVPGADGNQPRSPRGCAFGRRSRRIDATDQRAWRACRSMAVAKEIVDGGCPIMISRRFALRAMTVVPRKVRAAPGVTVNVWRDPTAAAVRAGLRICAAKASPSTTQLNRRCPRGVKCWVRPRTFCHVTQGGLTDSRWKAMCPP